MLLFSIVLPLIVAEPPLISMPVVGSLMVTPLMLALACAAHKNACTVRGGGGNRAAREIQRNRVRAVAGIPLNIDPSGGCRHRNAVDGDGARGAKAVLGVVSDPDARGGAGNTTAGDGNRTASRQIPQVIAVVVPEMVLLLIVSDAEVWMDSTEIPFYCSLRRPHPR